MSFGITLGLGIERAKERARTYSDINPGGMGQKQPEKNSSCETIQQEGAEEVDEAKIKATMDHYLNPFYDP